MSESLIELFWFERTLLYLQNGSQSRTQDHTQLNITHGFVSRHPLFFLYMWAKAIWMCNKILWNQSKYVLLWHNVVKRGTGWAFSGPGMVRESFWQWGLAGCESLLHLQDSIGVFTWILLKIFRNTQIICWSWILFFFFSSMSDKLLLWLCEIMDTSGIFSILRILMNVNIHFIWTFTVCASSLFNWLNHKSKKKGASVNFSAAIRILHFNSSPCVFLYQQLTGNKLGCKLLPSKEVKIKWTRYNMSGCRASGDWSCQQTLQSNTLTGIWERVLPHTLIYGHTQTYCNLHMHSNSHEK